ncbi:MULTISPECIES: response regulator [unclassified Luteimonas]
MSRAPGQPYRVLLIEDSRDDAELISIALRDGGLRVDCTHVWSADAVRQALRDTPPQLVLSDLNLPGFSAEEALALVRAHDPALPFVLLTGAPLLGLSDDPPLAADAALSKDDLHQLPALVRSLVA